MQDDHLDRLADEFLDWAAGENLLVSRAMALKEECKPTNQSAVEGEARIPEGSRQQRKDGFNLLREELGSDLQAIKTMLREDPAHFVGTAPRPRTLVIATAKRPPSGRPHRTASGIRIEYASGKPPEMRLALTAIKPARTHHGPVYPCGTSISLGTW